jgi:hypothetical protein
MLDDTSTPDEVQFNEAELQEALNQLEEIQQTSPENLNVDYNTYAPDAGSWMFFGGVWLLIWLALFVTLIVSMWKIFQKAGKPGWAAIVPFYNIYVMLQVAGLPGWWLILFFVPFVNVIIGIIAIVYFVKSFGRGAGFAVATIFFPYVTYPILAFGKDKYVGPAYKG